MGRLSSIKRLPAALRQLIERLRGDGRTIAEILAKLGELDVTVSQSALGRWTRQLDAIADSARRNRSLAEAVIDRLGDKPDDRVTRMNIEIMHAALTRLSYAEDGTPVAFDAKEVLLLSTALQRLASAQKLDADRELGLRAAERKDAAERAVTAAGEQARASGFTLPPEALAKIREQVYGVVDAGSPR